MIQTQMDMDARLNQGCLISCQYLLQANSMNGWAELDEETARLIKVIASSIFCY
jgi:hypothetical protein